MSAAIAAVLIITHLCAPIHPPRDVARPDRRNARRAAQRLETTMPLSTGYVLVRVPVIGPDGATRDKVEAESTFGHEPWADTARYLGPSSVGADDRLWHLFERPAPVAAP